MIKYGNLNVNVIGNANKIYQGLTMNGYQWVDFDRKITFDEWETCTGVKFSVDDFIAHPSFIGDISKMVISLYDDRCGELMFYKFVYDDSNDTLTLESKEKDCDYMIKVLGEWHSGEIAEIKDINVRVFNEALEEDIPHIELWLDRKGSGRVVYQRISKGEQPIGTWVSYQSGGTFTGNENVLGIRITEEEAWRLLSIEDYEGGLMFKENISFDPEQHSLGVIANEQRIHDVDGDEDIPLVDGYFTLTLDSTKEWRISHTEDGGEVYQDPPYPIPFNCELLIRG